MYYVYVISSICRNYIYVGISNNPARRFEEHNSGYERTTKPYRPFNLILVESYPDRTHARIREKYLKSSSGKRYIRELIG
jgi:putative endonuclease